MKEIYLKLAVAILFAITIGAESVLAVGSNHGPCVIPEETLDQLKQARQFTARYNSVHLAEAAGYQDIFLPIENMGEHYLNFGLLDGVFDPLAPEALVYADFGNGSRRLVAVEYIVPIAASPNAPEGFPGSCDDWHVFGGQLWTLHAWIWYPNQDGVFAALNPAVP